MAVFDAEDTPPLEPSEGLNVLSISMGDVIDIVIQNNPANAFNGDYRFAFTPSH